MTSTAARWLDWVRRGRPGEVAAVPLSPVTFPSLPLRPRGRLALGADLAADPLTWTWTDITQYMRWDDGVDTSDGRGDQSSLVTTGSTSATLTNDGRFSTRNPFGPYWGLLTPNTPIWLELDAGAGMYTVVQHFVNEWPTRWSPGALDCVTPIKCSGALGRLQRGDDLPPPMERAIRASNPVTFWTLADGVDATQAGSAIAGGSPMKTTFGTPVFGGLAGPAGGPGPLVDLSAARMRGTVPVGSTAPTSWSFELIANVIESATDGFVASLKIGAGITEWRIYSQTTTLPTALDITGGGLFSAAARDEGFSAEWHHYLVNHTAAGDAELWYDGVLVASGSGGTVAAPTAMSLNPALGSNGPLDVTAGYAAVYLNTTVDAADRYQAMLAWVGELDFERIVRECGFSGVPIQCTSGTGAGIPLGPQPAGTLLDVLRDAEKGGMGVLYEVGWGLGYQPLRDRYDAPVAMALDFNEGHVDGEPEPADDNKDLVNRWKVTRADGSSATAEDTTSRLGTQAGGPGVFSDSITVNVETDDQVPDHAWWRLHRDTLDEDRWPQIDFNFASLGGQALIPTWVTLGYGARITLDNPPPQVNQAQINLVIEGRRQFFNSLQWTASINASPASTYQVARYGPSLQYIRYDTRGSTLTANVSDSATSWSVTIASGYPLWVTTATHPDRFAPAGQPMYLLVGGVVYECTAIVGASSPQTFTVVRLATDKTHLAGAPIRVYQPPIYGL